MFDIPNMGESALTSHMKGKKHLKRVPTISGSQNSYFNVSESIDLSAPSDGSNNHLSAHSTSSISKSLLGSMMVSITVAHAEICWALKIVISEYSKSDDTVQLFKVMLPGSKVPESFSFAKMKSRFIITYGLKRNLNILSRTVLLHISFSILKMN